MSPTSPQIQQKDVTCPDLEIEEACDSAQHFGLGHNSNQCAASKLYSKPLLSSQCRRRAARWGEGGGDSVRQRTERACVSSGPCFEDYFLSKPRSTAVRRRHGRPGRGTVTEPLGRRAEKAWEPAARCSSRHVSAQRCWTAAGTGLHRARVTHGKVVKCFIFSSKG